MVSKWFSVDGASVACFGVLQIEFINNIFIQNTIIATRPKLKLTTRTNTQTKTQHAAKTHHKIMGRLGVTWMGCHGDQVYCCGKSGVVRVFGREGEEEMVIQVGGWRGRLMVEG